MIKHDVPVFSQHALEIPEEWRSRACGVSALAMALSFINQGDDVTIPQLIDEGLASGAYLSGIGWKHAGLVSLAEDHGARAWRREFRRMDGVLQPLAPLYTRWYLRRAIRQGALPIVSLRIEGIADTHLVPLVGFDADGWYYNDSAKHNAEEGRQLFMDHDLFGSRFRKLAIFVGPRL